MLLIFSTPLFMIPLSALAYLVAKLLDYSQIKKENKLNPGTHDEEAVKFIKSRVILACVLVVVSIAVVAGLVHALSKGIAYM